eukprot:jgi/Botrbrau1/23077/Bobra.0243s0018.1
MSIETVDVAIVGGGPGGLAAATAIKRVDPLCNVKVYERASQLREVGFTLGLMGNGLNALEALDPSLFEVIFNGLLEDGPVVQYDKSGNLLFTLTSAVDIFKQWNPRVGHCTWFELQKTLADGLPEGTLQLGCSLKQLQPVEGGVELQFTDGRTVHAKVAIGADGNQSKTRALLLNDGQPSYAGQAVWRGQCKAPEGWPYFENFLTGWAGGAQRILTIRLREGRLAWQCMAPWPEERLGELMSARYLDAEATRAAWSAKLKRCQDMYADWTPLVQEVIASTPADTITEHGQYFRDPAQCQKWGEGPVSLLGDAAHLMTPFLGQGVNQTLEDAVELGRAIGEYGPTEAALRQYELVRVPAATRVQAGSVGIMTEVAAGARPTERDWFSANPDVLSHMPIPLQTKAASIATKVSASALAGSPQSVRHRFATLRHGFSTRRKAIACVDAPWALQCPGLPCRALFAL